MPKSTKKTDDTAKAAKTGRKRKPAAETATETKAVQTPKAGAKQTKEAKAATVCLCGCGVQTGGGRFLPGHDARLKSALLAAFRNGGLSADQEALVDELGWRHLLTAAPASKRKGRDPGQVAALRAQLAHALDTARDDRRSRAERLSAVRWLDRILRAADTADADLDAVVGQLRNGKAK
jgi:hypothetical protein